MNSNDIHNKLSEFGKELLNKKSLEDGLAYVSEYVKNNFEADRCSIFIYNSKNHELWTSMSDGVDKIIVSSDLGIVGQTLRTKKTIIENEAYENVNFLPDIDMETGYLTKNIISTPIYNSQREIIGVLEFLNKEGGFNNEEDVKFATFFAHYISVFIELNNIYKC